MINQVCIPEKRKSVISFSADSENFRNKGNIPKVNTADAFIAELNELNSKNKNGNFYSKYLWSPTAITAGLLLPFAYEIYTGMKIHRLKKQANSSAKLKQIRKTLVRNVLLASALGIGVVSQGIQYLFKKNTDKNFEILKKDFDMINTRTSATLSDDSFCSSYEGASFNIGSGR